MKYKIVIAYNGRHYSGFQIQNNVNTIQETLEKVLSKVLDAPIKINASGRTDAMVSALRQVCDFEIDSDIDVKRLVGFANAELSDIKILSCTKVDDDFHSRFSAKRKTYTYFFYGGNLEHPIFKNIAYCTKCSLDIEKMKTACKLYVGEHDFTSFCAANTDVDSKVRHITDAKIYNVYDDIYAFEVTGNGFLYNMVRIMMGVLIDIGRNKQDVDYINTLFKVKDRTKASKTVPGEYLLLKRVEYKDDIID